MPSNFWLHWIVYLIPRIVVWPILWHNMRQRRLHRKPDEWHPLDRWLVAHGHVVRTYGYFFWEKMARVCRWCVALWAIFIGGAGYVGYIYY